MYGKDILCGNRKSTIEILHKMILSMCWKISLIQIWNFASFHIYELVDIFSHDVIKWKDFLRYWAFVRGIHRSNKRLSKQSWDWWFVTPLWSHCNDMSPTDTESQGISRYPIDQVYLYYSGHSVWRVHELISSWHPIHMADHVHIAKKIDCQLFSEILGASWIVIAIHSLRPGDAIWWQRSRSTLAQVMAWCLTAPSQYLNQCWAYYQ